MFFTFGPVLCVLNGSRNSQKNVRYCAGQGNVENWLQRDMYKLCDHVALSTFVHPKRLAVWPPSRWMILVLKKVGRSFGGIRHVGRPRSRWEQAVWRDAVESLEIQNWKVAGRKRKF